MSLKKVSWQPAQHNFGLEPENIQANNSFWRQEAVRHALRTALIGALGAGSIRAGVGLYHGLDLVGREKDPSSEEKHRLQVTLPPKFAGAFGPIGDAISGVANSAYKTVSDLNEAATPAQSGRIRGLDEVSLNVPLMLAGGIAGVGMGWKGTEHLVNALRRRKVKKELQNAQQEYAQALYGNGSNTKIAELVGFIDKLAEAYEQSKQAGLDDVKEVADRGLAALNDGVMCVGRAAPSAYGAYLALAGGLAGWAGLRQYRKRMAERPDVIRAKALNELRSRYKLKPPTIRVATPMGEDDEAVLD